MSTLGEPSGHVFRVERQRGAVWYAKYRLPDGRQIQKGIGPAWSERGRPPVGYVTKRTAESWLQDVLSQARHGTLLGMRTGGATFGQPAEEWLRFIAQDRERMSFDAAGLPVGVDRAPSASVRRPSVGVDYGRGDRGMARLNGELPQRAFRLVQE